MKNRRLPLTVAMILLASSKAIAMTVLPPPDNSAAAKEAVYSLAQGCYSIQSPATSKHARRYHNGGAVDNGLSYELNAHSVGEAEKFYLKPTSFSHYLIYDRDGRYLATHQPLQVSAGRYAGSYAEWKLDAVQSSNGQFEYQMHNLGMNRTLRHGTDLKSRLTLR
ncbi:MAG: hypothetical protein ACR2PX_18240 [Endozoicomonas sp.]|uniref:hypothetical protein n=1 Tax=Endozoicomonas sp. TaxID=1892382 RepID=UPI003D9AE9B9